uniref:Uncharacterized protein n=1 Tax=Entomoneis paludosa TaxID=265537 RepID=A0A7S3DR60_9STRA|mmetsp:Transcript_29408/g.61502  ORF Transcript_29408/g.61502 Transcript_29408/m.61502 type:complete len:182 (+) Transcript_29408:164-709(+)
MLPQDLQSLIRGSSRVIVVCDNAKGKIKDPHVFSSKRRLRPRDRLSLDSSISSHILPSVGIDPMKSNCRWDPEVRSEEDDETRPADKEETQEEPPIGKKKSNNMGLSLPVRRNSTDSVDAAMLAEIFDDLGLLDDSSDEKEDEEIDDTTFSTVTTGTTQSMHSSSTLSSAMMLSSSLDPQK